VKTQILGNILWYDDSNLGIKMRLNYSIQFNLFLGIKQDCENTKLVLEFDF